MCRSHALCAPCKFFEPPYLLSSVRSENFRDAGLPLPSWCALAAVILHFPLHLTSFAGPAAKRPRASLLHTDLCPLPQLFSTFSSVQAVSPLSLSPGRESAPVTRSCSASFSLKPQFFPLLCCVPGGAPGGRFPPDQVRRRLEGPTSRPRSVRNAVIFKGFNPKKPVL